MNIIVNNTYNKQYELRLGQLIRFTHNTRKI